MDTSHPEYDKYDRQADFNAQAQRLSNFAWGFAILLALIAFAIGLFR
jgi:hypothetical protein